MQTIKDFDIPVKNRLRPSKKNYKSTLPTYKKRELKRSRWVNFTIALVFSFVIACICQSVYSYANMSKIYSANLELRQVTSDHKSNTEEIQKTISELKKLNSLLKYLKDENLRLEKVKQAKTEKFEYLRNNPVE